MRERKLQPYHYRVTRLSGRGRNLTFYATHRRQADIYAAKWAKTHGYVQLKRRP